MLGGTSVYRSNDIRNRKAYSTNPVESIGTYEGINFGVASGSACPYGMWPLYRKIRDSDGMRLLTCDWNECSPSFRIESILGYIAPPGSQGFNNMNARLHRFLSSDGYTQYYTVGETEYTMYHNDPTHWWEQWQVGWVW